MYTAKIKGKSLNEGRLWINVEFTDGITTLVEGISPQDEEALKTWVKERLNFLNYTKDAITKLKDGEVIDTSKPIVEEKVKPKEEKSREEWLEIYYKWIKVKSTLIDTGILTGNETPVLALKNKVKADFLPNYINFI